ncbi:MAG TPA: MMPL family transporter [Solirubrobacterales bacterium]|jgi:RND superfamily putative drug exporter|nr:MMPL family transporter [Solirubrobacterales bacterium]
MTRVARLLVWLRYPLLLAWIAGAILAGTRLPSIFSAESEELGNLLPSSSRALEVERRAIHTFGLPLLSRTIVVASQPGGFSTSQGAAAARYVTAVDRRPDGEAELRAVPLLDAPGLLASRDLGTALVVYLFIDPALGETESQEAADDFAAGLRRATGAPAVHVTGALPATRAETEIVESHLPWVELATLLLVVGILALYFRSPGVPLLGLATVAIAYEVADHVLGWMAERYSISIPREVDPVIVALLFGVMTDYLVFFVSGYRRRLEEGAAPRQAVIAVTAELLPVIATAGLMIAGATLTLLISGVHFLSAFGPGMAVAVLIGALVALTFVPAALAVFGRALLWPRAPRARSDKEEAGGSAASGDGATPHPARAETGTPRGRLVGFAAHHPALVTVLCLLVLGAAASGLRMLEIGNPLLRGLPESTSPRRGYDVAAASLGPGVLGPTMLVLEGRGVAYRSAALAELQTALGEADGVAGVVGPADQPLRQPYGIVKAASGNAARYVLVLDADPEGAAAANTLAELEADLPGMLERSGLGYVTVGITGDTTIAAELGEGTWRAFERVAPAALAVLLLLLWVLLRSRTAPLYLVGASVLVAAAALGLTVYLFQGLLGYGELAFFVPIATAILLLALGADYNVFLISRIWREADRRDLRPAIRTAGSRAARAITVAGLILALSFAAVALIPIQSFRELAFAMFAGLLLDTLLARTLLIPALVSLSGRGPRQPARGPRPSPPEPARAPDDRRLAGSPTDGR